MPPRRRAGGYQRAAQTKYEDWRFGKVQYLEQVCTCNLKKLSFIMHQICAYAKKTNLKPSFCYYKRWDVKKKMEKKTDQEYEAI